MQNDQSIPIGSDVSSGTFECLDCGERITVQSSSSLPPCPKGGMAEHTKNGWRAVSGQGDAKDDPYPDVSRRDA